MDANGNSGYPYIFMIFIASMLITSAGGLWLYKLYKKEKENDEAANVAEA